MITPINKCLIGWIRSIVIWVLILNVLTHILDGLSTENLCLWVLAFFADLILIGIRFLSHDEIHHKTEILTQNLKTFQTHFQANNEGLDELNDNVKQLTDNLDEHEFETITGEDLDDKN